MLKQFFRLKFCHVLYVFFFIFLFVLLLNNSFSYLDPDLGWHLEAGKHVWKTGSVPEVNQYNYPLQGREWVDHEWLMDAFTYFLFDSHGYIVVSVFFAFLVLAVFALLYYWLYRFHSRRGSVYLLFAFLLLWGTVAMLPHMGVRIQEVTLLNLVLLLLLLEIYLYKQKTRTILWLIPLMYIWACLHGGFLVGLVLMFGFAGVKFLEWGVYQKYNPSFLQEKRVLLPSAIGRYVMVALAAFISTFFTPYGVKLYSFLAGYTNTFYLTHIKEWFPQYFIQFNYFQLFYIGLVLVTLFLYLFYGVKLKRREYKVDLWWIVLVVLLLIMAIKSRRHFPLLFTGTLPFIVFFFVKFLELKRKTYWTKFSLWLNIYLLVVFVVSISFVLLSTNFTTRPFAAYCNKYPCKAVEFLKKNPQYQDHNLLTRYDWGGYMIHQYPEGKLFIDGRMPQYKIDDSTMLEEYYNFFKEDKVSSQLEKHDVEMVLFGHKERSEIDLVEQWVWDIKNDNINDRYNILREYLEENKEWRKIFTSDTSMLYSKE